VTDSPRTVILSVVQGLVKFFDADRGFGFVHNEGGSWWFHRSYCKGEPPATGDTVEFWLEDGSRGDLVAVDVTRVDPTISLVSTKWFR
jgi:cold shock CspA family protein